MLVFKLKQLMLQGTHNIFWQFYETSCVRWIIVKNTSLANVAFCWLMFVIRRVTMIMGQMRPNHSMPSACNTLCNSIRIFSMLLGIYHILDGHLLLQTMLLIISILIHQSTEACPVQTLTQEVQISSNIKLYWLAKREERVKDTAKYILWESTLDVPFK